METAPDQAPTLPTPGVPKTIWIMWLQGPDKMPPVARQCYNSWRALNPDWKIVFLDENNYGDYVDIKAVLATDNHLEVQAVADVIRINLLAKHGGVWIDATCYCCVPLDDWLEEAAASGFFAFAKPHKNRLMDNWFMASHRGCYLTERLAEASNYYWLSNHKLRKHHKTLTSRALTLLQKNTFVTRYWFSQPVRKVLKAYPYMWFQYLFTELVRTDARFQRIWDQTPKLSADLPHALQHMGMFKPLTETAKNHIDGKKSPLYKLRWRFKQSLYTEATTLHYLLSQPLPDAVTSLAGAPTDAENGA